MNSIHPSAQIQGDVTLGSGNTIGPFVVLIGPLTIGDGNWLGAGVIVGAPPEVRGWKHPADVMSLSSGKGIQIGSGNIIREYAQVHQGWADRTQIGDNAFVMNQTYIAHDCVIENDVTLASSVLLAGHVRVGKGANIGLGTSVHQRRYVGHRAMVGMGSVVTRDVPPFSKAFGNPARVRGANSVGIERDGIDPLSRDMLEQFYSRNYNPSDLLVLKNEPGLGYAIEEWCRFSRP